MLDSSENRIVIPEIPDNPNDLAYARESIEQGLLPLVAEIRAGWQPTARFCGLGFPLVTRINLIFSGEGSASVDKDNSDEEITATVVRGIYEDMAAAQQINGDKQ